MALIFQHYGKSLPPQNPRKAAQSSTKPSQPYKSDHFLEPEVLLALLRLVPLMLLVVLPELNRLEEVLGVIGLSGLGDVLLDGQVEHRDQEVQVGEGFASARVVVPEMLVFFIDAPDLG